MGPRKLLKEGELTKAKSRRKLHVVLCNDIVVLIDETAKSLYRMVRLWTYKQASSTNIIYSRCL